MGGFTLIMLTLRGLFDLRESPKFLMGRGKDAQAVETIHAVAKYNSVESTLVVGDLSKVDTDAGESNNARYTTVGAAVERNLERFKFDHIRALFATKELAFSTSLVITLWALIGLACEYPVLLSELRSTHLTRNFSSPV